MTNRLFALAMAGMIALGSTACAQAEGEAESPAKETIEVTVAVMTTTEGTITFRLFPEAAPKACENLEKLAKKGYYEGIIFHRVIDGFMIQGGDPTGSGYGGKSFWGVPFEDEFSPELRFDRPFLLAMANSGPKTNGSQFFITLAPTPHLNDKHTIYGEVIEGMDIIKKIGGTEVGPNDKPTTEIKIEKVEIETREIEG
ncbi:peptidylprolyl isomerase [bacterium]|nr:MAG: peptidylprolyl isomerase [bacterium]